MDMARRPLFGFYLAAEPLDYVVDRAGCYATTIPPHISQEPVTFQGNPSVIHEVSKQLDLKV